jgi:pectate lyase
MNGGLTILLSLVLISVSSECAEKVYQAPADDKLPAFPGAEGFGKYSTGGRGGDVVIVTNLEDSGPGSFREAAGLQKPRTVVFEVSGTIALKSPIRITSGDLTIAGQTAPGDGICVRNYNVSVDADNVIIRYMRFRLGDEAKQQDDAFTGLRRKNIIIDHCSMSWATDECASFYDNENFTMQWCIISESLNHSVHEKGDHGYGGIWGGKGATFCYNLLAHHNSRLPRFCGSRYHKMPEKEIVDFRNNVIYNWKGNSSYAGERGNHNMVANYYKAGPATKVNRNKIANPWQPYGKFYVSENYVEGDDAVTNDNWNGGVRCDHLDSVRVNEAFPVIAITQQRATDAFMSVLSKAGASLKRDAVDIRVTDEVRKGTAAYGDNKTGIINSQKDVGGWPELKTSNVPRDTDRDGMPDKWEEDKKLNPEKIDATAFDLNKHYTNLEVYLNSLIIL